MKKSIQIALIVAVTSFSYSYAQIGIPSNNPNKDAVLDLNNTNGTASKGLLLPQVALTGTGSSAPLNAHIAGMHVYNTATAGSGTTQVTPGEYSNDGTSWRRVATSGWGLQGNANTTNTNFLGTTDAVDFVTRTNNVERMRISSAGKLLLGTTTVPTGGTNAKVIVNNGTTAGALQLKDGTEGNNYILTSDANGVATWQPQILQVFFAQNFGAGVAIPPNPFQKWYYSGTSIALPPGKWLVSVTVLLTKGVGVWTGATENWTLNSTFSDSSSTLNFSADIVGGNSMSGILPPNSQFNILSGSVIINNTTSSNKTYYYIGRIAVSSAATGTLQGFGGAWAENNISWQAID